MRLSTARTIIELFEITAHSEDPEATDAIPAVTTRIGVYSSLGRVYEWLNRTAASRAKDMLDDGGGTLLHYFTATIVALDGERGHIARYVFDANGKYRGALTGHGEDPFLGRPESDCLYRPGDLVSWIYFDEYRIGIILTAPPSPERTKAWNRAPGGCPITRSDDLYMVGLLDPRGPDHDDHDHVPQCLLWLAPVNLDAELVNALRDRRARYEPSGS